MSTMPEGAADILCRMYGYVDLLLLELVVQTACTWKSALHTYLRQMRSKAGGGQTGGKMKISNELARSLISWEINQ